MRGPPLSAPCRQPPGPQEVIAKAADIQNAVSEGANSFLFTEYKYMGIFMASAPPPPLPLGGPGPPPF